MIRANRERTLRVAEASPRRLTTFPSSASIALQRNADRVMDALDLLAVAQRAGLTPRRSRRLREILMQPAVSDATVDRSNACFARGPPRATPCVSGCNTPVSSLMEALG
jgi:hypothetical protein